MGKVGVRDEWRKAPDKGERALAKRYTLSVEGLNVYSQGAAWWCVRPGLEEVSLEESPDIDAEVLTIQLKCLSTG